MYLYLVDAEVTGGPRRRPTPAGENTSAALPILRDSRVRARSSERDRVPSCYRSCCSCCHTRPPSPSPNSQILISHHHNSSRILALPRRLQRPPPLPQRADPWRNGRGGESVDRYSGTTGSLALLATVAWGREKWDE